MKKTTRNQNGSSHLVMVLVVALVALIGFAALRVVNNKSTTDTAVVSTPVTTASIPAKIENKTQAAQASKALDAEAIDKSLDSTSLNNDLKSVL